MNIINKSFIENNTYFYMSLFLLFMAIINKWLIVVLMCIPFPIFPSRGMHCVPNPFINCKMSPALLYDCNSAFMQFDTFQFLLTFYLYFYLLIVVFLLHQRRVPPHLVQVPLGRYHLHLYRAQNRL